MVALDLPANIEAWALDGTVCDIAHQPFRAMEDGLWERWTAKGFRELAATRPVAAGAKAGIDRKATLPTLERVICTIRNANWVLAYWTCEPAPDPIQHAFGFRQLPNGGAEYDD